MIDYIKDWLERYLSDYEAVVLLILLVFGFIVVLSMGYMLAPVFAALVLSFLMQGIINWLNNRGVAHLLAVMVVFSIFITFLLLFLLVMVPLILEQVTRLLSEVPRMVYAGNELLTSLPELYPGFVSEEQVVMITEFISIRLAGMGQWALSFSLSKLPGAVGLLIYLIVVPILIFFLLKG